MASILVVCTGNICRSPVAEGFLRQVLAARGLDGFQVESAGVAGLDGYPAEPEAVDALRELGIDISGHRAQRLTRRMIDSADLVLAMSADHRDAIVRLAPASAHKTFTLKELVFLLELHDGQDEPKSAGPAVERMQAAISAADAMRKAGRTEDLRDEDVPDPLGMGSEAFRAAAWQIEGLVERLAVALFGPDGAGEDARAHTGARQTRGSQR